MPDLVEAAGRRRSDLFTGAVVADQRRKARLDRLVAPPQGVVVRIGDLRVVLLMVQPVMTGDLRGQPG